MMATRLRDRSKMNSCQSVSIKSSKIVCMLVNHKNKCISKFYKRYGDVRLQNTSKFK